MQKRRMIDVLSLLAAFALVGCADTAPVETPTTRSITEDKKADKSPEVALASIRSHILKAETESAAAADRAIRSVNEYVNKRKEGAAPFASAVLSFEGKMKALEDAATHCLRHGWERAWRLEHDPNSS